MASGALLGAAVGALIASFITDKLGRKFLLIADIIIYIIGALLSALTINVLMLMFARTFIGVAIGADSAIATAYIAEFAPRKHRGKLGIMQQYMIVIGIFISFIVAIALFETAGNMCNPEIMNGPYINGILTPLAIINNPISELTKNALFTPFDSTCLSLANSYK